MKTRFYRTLSLLCVLALVVSLCSMFSFAVTPETEIEPRTGGVHYVVSKTGTYMYNSASTNSGYKFPSPISVGEHLVRVGESGSFFEMTYNSYTGYVLKSHVTEVQ